ncbi:MAG TPA: hypothetical protein PK385_09820 [Spirochaetota bacterium]|nr:hypothetical protein [Spirochaetota bacterium]HOS32672.1 hypothetical protein [Spirochaetota bacterium]HOS56343.1 hypothetical protein [Spirochaetota bacterium]HQF78302.1 hypothetical protein [Spirochaetota bacterium]HQH29335.1 hypothetical protein [Spirochaetota bacterium]
MENNLDDYLVSEGEEIASISEMQKLFVQNNRENILREDTKSDISGQNGDDDGDFTDLFETDTPENIFINDNKSIIDSIEFLNYKDYFPELSVTIDEEIRMRKAMTADSDSIDSAETAVLEEDPSDKATLEEVPLKTPKLKKRYKISNFKKSDNNRAGLTEITDTGEMKIDGQEILSDEKQEEPFQENIQEDILIKKENFDGQIDALLKKINDKNNSVAYPGKIDLTAIDSSLSQKSISFEKDSEDIELVKDDEMFGVKKSEILDNIDKNIGASRSSSSFDISKIKNLRAGFFLPLMVFVISFAFIFLAIPALSLYFQKTSTLTLEDNVINDSSILEKIAKQKEEEARNARLRLEEERRKLESDRNKMESLINEESFRRQLEIENLYKEKYTALEKRGLSEADITKIRKQLEDEKRKELDSVEKEKERQINEQKKALVDKNKELESIEKRLKDAIANKEFEISNITKTLETQLKEKDAERESISKKLKELSETNVKIKEFNDIIYQLISGSIDEFKKNNAESGLLKLDTVLRYYESRIDFVNANPDLKNKMVTDVFFVQSLNKYVSDLRSSSTFNKEYVELINKFKQINEYYKNAETFYSQRNWSRSSEEYDKVIAQINEVNSSYKRIKEIDKHIQNIKAANYYNSAVEYMKSGNYDLALNNFGNVIKETPMSDYTSQSVDSIFALSNTLLANKDKSEIEKINSANVGAKVLFDGGVRHLQNKRFDQAADSFSEVILKYPISDYAKQSHTNLVLSLQNKYKEEENKIYANLKSKFSDNYEKYKKLNDEGKFREARGYYFAALNSAFGIYTNETVEEFKRFEDRYIFDEINKNKGIDEKQLKIQLETAKKEIEDEYNKLLNAQKEKYEREIAAVNLKYSQEIASLTAERDNLKIAYDNLLKSASANESLAAKLKEYDEKLKQKDIELAELNAKYKASTENAGAAKLELEEKIVALTKEKENLEAELYKMRADMTKGAVAEVALKTLITEKDKEIVNLKKEKSEAIKTAEFLKKMHEDELAKIRVEKDMLTADLEGIRKENAGYKTSIENYTKQLKDKDAAIAALNKKYSELEKSSSATKSNAEELKRLEELAAKYKTERDKIQSDYDNLLKNREGEEMYKKLIAQKESEISNLNSLIEAEKSKNIESAKKYERTIANLQRDKETLEKEYKILHEKRASNEDVSLEVAKVKKRYDEIIVLKDREIEKLKNAPPVTYTDEKIKNELARIEKELQNEKINSQKLKEQLVETYKKYSELETKNKLSSGELADKYKNMYDKLQEDYKKLDSELKKARSDKENYENTLTNKIKAEYEEKFKQDKQELIRNFNIELDRLNKIILLQNKIDNAKKYSDKDTESGDSLNTKLLARIVDKIGDSVSFQFFSLDSVSKVKRGDILTVVRIAKIGGDNKELIVGKIEVTHTDVKSIYGRGVAKSANSGFDIEINDLIR